MNKSMSNDNAVFEELDHVKSLMLSAVSTIEDINVINPNDHRRRLKIIQRQLAQLDSIVTTQIKNIPRDQNDYHMIKPDNKGSSRIENGPTGFKILRQFTYGAESLIICDPYFFALNKNSSSDYIGEIIKTTRMRKTHLRRIHIIHSSKKGNNKNFKRGFMKECSDYNIHCVTKDTNLIHDRFWIKEIRNTKTAKIIGTSLSGLGKRLSFIVSMPKEDLTDLMHYLREENLV